MNDPSRVLVASLAGAVVGAVVGFLYFTDGGRRLRDELEPRLDDVAKEIRRLRSTVTKAQAVANEGRRSLNELIGERQQSQQSSMQGRQSSPF
jgi:gas vesicle protein